MRLLFVLLIFPFSLFSQTGIDQIRNDSDVVKFVRDTGSEYFPWAFKGGPLPDVTFDLYGRYNIYREKMNAADVKFTDSAIAKRWLLADFDKDGFKDLVYYGKIANEAGIYVFFGGGSRKMIGLSGHFANWYPHSIALHTVGEAPGIIVGTLEQPDWPAKQQKSYAERFFHDTLVYQFGGFVEYNKDVRPGPAFDSIVFRPLSNWITNNTWYMQIYRDGTVNLYQSRDTAAKKRRVEFITEKMVATIDPKEWQDMLDYIDFAHLKDSLAVKNVTDQTVALTTVYFSNGQKKTVWDYGMSGTYGLQAFYARIRFWVETGQWRVVASRKGYLGYKGVF